MTTDQEITSLADFMGWVQRTLPGETERQQETQAFFYRGHADEAYQLLPSAYRIVNGKSYRAVEYHLYQDMLYRNPDAFAEDKTIFERLVRMQHHGLPTRLLDLTQNPLVALFFACNEHPDKNGQVMFFYRAQSEILYPSAISQVALAGLEDQLDLSRLGYIAEKYSGYFEDQKSYISSDHEEFNKAYHQLLADCVNDLNQAMEHSDLVGTIAFLQQMETRIPEFYKQWDDYFKREIQGAQKPEQKEIALRQNTLFTTLFNQFNGLKKSTITNYCEQMHIPYNASWDCLYKFLGQFVNIKFVYPPLNNKRIRRQQGVFLICPPGKTELYNVDKFHKPVVTKIKAEAKKTLLKELANLGITRSYLFPELEKQARDIRERYPPT